MTFQHLKFKDLKTQQLYDILQLRSEVFVVEQDCVYQDIDGYDQIAIHICAYTKNTLVAYARILPPKTYFQEPSIGRIIVKASHRKQNLGHKLMDYCISQTNQLYPHEILKISAQQYLIEFYNTHGFKEKGEGYLEDGIPHVAMYRKF